MAIITRLSRLLRADLNAMLDRLEAPELVLAQAVREMEQAQASEQIRLRRLEQEAARDEQRQAEIEQRLAQHQGALKDCLAAGQDDLARAVLRRKLEAERALARLNQSADENNHARTQCQARLSEQDNRLNDLRARAAVFETGASNIGGEDVDFASAASDSPPIRDADIEIALLQAKRQQEAAA